MEYWKINSLYKRRLDGDRKIIFGDYSCPEFANIKHWRVTEKIDGTNIRIELTIGYKGEIRPEDIKIAGRTDNASIPAELLNHLKNHFTPERFGEQFAGNSRVILFGEGYGPKIQGCGSLYAGEQRFVLFDVIIGNWVLQFDDVKEMAYKLEIPHVPDFGVLNTDEVVEFVKSGPKSIFSQKPQIMEGVVCFSEPLMLFRNGNPLKMKLKVKDF